MKFNLHKIKKKIEKNGDKFLLLLLFFISIISTQAYNSYKDGINQNYVNLINNIYFKKSLKHIFENLEPKYIEIEHKISNGETFNKILKKYKIPLSEIKKIKESFSKEVDLNDLKTNQIIRITINQITNKKITSFLFPLSRTKRILLIRNIQTNKFEKKEIITNLNRKVIFKEGTILQSLYKTATDLNIHPNIIIEFAQLYGFQVDFQRDIRKKDTFQIVYETFEDDDGKIFETGNIIFANLKLRGQDNSLYYFDKDKGYYDKNGRSVKKALMKTPINGARLSSSFGMRKHPIDGFNKMHKGTDFAAKLGTPIMASGNGIIIKAGWCGGGGNCIKIKHNSTYSTVYAHMSKFAKGIKAGIRVKQARIIGYVGSTGKSTGPHLHYEVIKNGKKINSQTLKLPSGKTLVKNERKLFEVEKIKIDVMKSELILGLN